MGFLKNIHVSDLSDQDLVILYKQGNDISVLGELFQRYMDLLYAVCLKYLKDPETAKDAVMAIFEDLVLKLKKHDVVHFRGWVYMVAKNHCLMQLRTKRQMPVTMDPDFMQLAENPHLNGVFEKEEKLNLLTKCMEGLSHDQEQSVRLFYLEKKSYREIAGITDTEWNTVRSLIQNGRRNLKNCMEKNITADD